MLRRDSLVEHVRESLLKRSWSIRRTSADFDSIDCINTLDNQELRLILIKNNIFVFFITSLSISISIFLFFKQFQMEWFLFRNGSVQLDNCLCQIVRIFKELIVKHSDSIIRHKLTSLFVIYHSCSESFWSPAIF